MTLNSMWKIFILVFALLLGALANAKGKKDPDDFFPDLPDDAAAMFTIPEKSFYSDGIRGSCSSGYCDFDFSGEINYKKVGEFKKGFDQLVLGLAEIPKTIFVSFKSEGGDVYAAMDMAEFLRSRPPSTSIAAEICASACVFAFLGPTTRLSAGGAMRIHRPYSVRRATPLNGQTASDFSRLDRDARAFLERMNVNVSLYDEMLRYSSEDMHILTEQELSKFRVTGTDYVYQDEMDTNYAARLGITKKELFERRSRARRVCGKIAGTDVRYGYCWDRAMRSK